MPQILDKINPRFGVFFMRFSKQDKINIYLLYQKGYPYSEIQRYYPIDESNFYYLVQILNRYGVSWLDRPDISGLAKRKRKPLIEYWLIMNLEEMLPWIWDYLVLEC